MKLGIITFDISNIGGIATHASHTYKSLRKVGIDCDLITIKQSNVKLQKIPIEEGATCSSLTTGGITVSIHEDKIKDTCNFLNSYDILFYTHACIHDKNAKWIEVYKLKNPKHLVTISDIFWEKFYPYYTEAIPYVTKFFATNTAVKSYLNKVTKIKPPIDSELLIHPFVFDNIGICEEKYDYAVWANQWRGWKGIIDWVNHIKRYQGTAVLFGTGREYYNLRETLDKLENIEYLGNRPPDEIQEAYRVSKFNIDLTGRSKIYWGHHNRTTIEGMFFGCLTVCYNSLVAPITHIPADICVVIKPKSIYREINKVQKDNDLFLEKAEKAYNWVTKYYTPENSANQILKYQDNLGIKYFI